MIPDEFERELSTLLNRHSIDAKLNTPDFVLASAVCFTLGAWLNLLGLEDRPWPGMPSGDVPPVGGAPEDPEEKP